MKKILMTLGLVATTLVATYAQDVTTPDEPATEVDMTEEAVVEEPIDETQEEVRTLQGEPAEPQRDSEMQTQANQDQIGEPGGVMSITQAELPQEVTDGLQDSEFAQATVEEAYVLEDEAVNKLMDDDANAKQMYIGDQLPDKIYQLRVNGEEGTNLLYFDETGELLGSKSI